MIYEKEKRYIIPFDDVPLPRVEMPEITVDERRNNFVEVETGFPEEMAVKEAKRCLGCRRCLGCALCWAECKPEAIDFDIPDETLELEFDECIITTGQNNLFYPVDSQLGYGKYPEVITDLQFDRMLSPTGPTNGLVLSPLDGQIPERIAIIQGHPEENDDHLLSSLIYGDNEAAIALDKTENLEVEIISPITQSFKENFLSDTENISGLKIINATPQSAAKDEKDSPLILKYSDNGEEKENKYDMIIVLTKEIISPELVSLSKKLDQEIV